MTKFYNGFLRLEKWFFGVSATVLVLLMLLVSANVLSRHFFESPVLGTLELTEFFMVAIVYLLTHLKLLSIISGNQNCDKKRSPQLICTLSTL